ncbi:MAG TPA: hypothetical protein VF742_13325 [Terracidiphilus sp.]|jgi:hypothetical protein
MKLILIIIVAAAIVGSIFADWKWRQWMEARRRERDRDSHPPMG